MFSLTHWTPIKDLLEIHKEMNKLFNAALGKYSEGHETGRMWAPALDLTEDKDNLYVRVEIPGMNKEDIKLELRDNSLILSGHKEYEYEDKKENLHRIERSYGQFRRVIELPETIQHQKINATYKDGILKITLPKTEETKPKQLEIKIK